MKITSRIAGFAFAFSLAVRGLAQAPISAKPAELELRLQAKSVQKNVPPAFTVLIVNKSKHEVRLPMPAVECGDVPHGSVWLDIDFKTLKPSPIGSGHGCIKDFAYQPIMDHLNGWKVLGPGQSLILSTINGYVSVPEAGTYDYWAYYDPPGMLKADEDILQKARIDYPKEKLESAHLKFLKRP